MRDVEADHRHVEAGVEDALRRLRVGPDVELGRGRHVALGDRAAHEDDPGRPRCRGRARARRSSAARPARARSRASRARRGSRRRAARSAPRRAPAARGRRGRSRRGRGRRRGARARAAGRRRRRPARPSRPTSASTRSALSVVFSSVWLPCDGRDADELDLRAREREQERDRVVVPGVAVEDDRSRHCREYRVHLGRGRQGRLRAEARGGERAGGAGAAQRLLGSRPSSSETSRQAVNASPAAVPSTASTGGGSARATSSPSSSRIAPSAPSVSATRPSRRRSTSSS